MLISKSGLRDVKGKGFLSCICATRKSYLRYNWMVGTFPCFPHRGNWGWTIRHLGPSGLTLTSYHNTRGVVSGLPQFTPVLNILKEVLLLHTRNIY